MENGVFLFADKFRFLESYEFVLADTLRASTQIIQRSLELPRGAPWKERKSYHCDEVASWHQKLWKMRKLDRTLKCKLLYVKWYRFLFSDNSLEQSTCSRNEISFFIEMTETDINVKNMNQSASIIEIWREEVLRVSRRKRGWRFTDGVKYQASEKSFFQICIVICFILDYDALHQDTLR